jgi:hypothetical protein
MGEDHQLGPTRDGSVMVDIGGDMGALVVITPPELAGHEIEISAASPDAVRVHVAVRERLIREKPPRYAAVFPSLQAGSYTLWRSKGGDEPAGTVVITGGEVTETDWPAQDRRRVDSEPGQQ